MNRPCQFTITKVVGALIGLSVGLLVTSCSDPAPIMREIVLAERSPTLYWLRYDTYDVALRGTSVRRTEMPGFEYTGIAAAPGEPDWVFVSHKPNSSFDPDEIFLYQGLEQEERRLWLASDEDDGVVDLELVIPEDFTQDAPEGVLVWASESVVYTTSLADMPDQGQVTPIAYAALGLGTEKIVGLAANLSEADGAWTGSVYFVTDANVLRWVSIPDGATGTSTMVFTEPVLDVEARGQSLLWFESGEVRQVGMSYLQDTSPPEPESFMSHPDFSGATMRRFAAWALSEDVSQYNIDGENEFRYLAYSIPLDQASSGTPTVVVYCTDDAGTTYLMTEFDDYSARDFAIVEDDG